MFCYLWGKWGNVQGVKCKFFYLDGFIRLIGKIIGNGRYTRMFDLQVAIKLNIVIFWKILTDKNCWIIIINIIFRKEMSICGKMVTAVEVAEFIQICFLREINLYIILHNKFGQTETAWKGHFYIRCNNDFLGGFCN